MSISEKQPNGPLLPTTNPPPLTPYQKSRITIFAHGVHNRLIALRAFLRSTTTLEGIYDFVAGCLRIGTLLTQVLCIAGIFVWAVELCIEAVVGGYVSRFLPFLTLPHGAIEIFPPITTPRERWR